MISGLVGVGLYALERLSDGAGERILALVVERLADGSRVTNNTRVWHTPPEAVPPLRRKEHPRGYHDLGVAHGAAGVVRLLAEAVNAGVKVKLARQMLVEAVPFILGNLRETPNGWTLPAYAESPPGASPRLAWCYNELGAMTAVYAAGRACGRDDWITWAEKVVRSSLGLPAEQSGCRDASLCHGAAGVAHMYQAFGLDIGDDSFIREAKRWFDVVLGMARPGHGSGGFLYFEVDPETRESRLVPNHSFLEGCTGVALVLLSAAWELSPGWNRLLALS